MANNKSAKKRIEINERNRLRNRYYKSSVRTLIKVFFQDLERYKTSKNPEEKEKLEKILSSIYSLIDKGTKKNIFHKNTAARKKAKLAAYLKAAVILSR
jgi:small subunit ribosomal protein S20